MAKATVKSKAEDYQGIKIHGLGREILDAETVRKVVEAWRIKCQIEDLKEKLEAIQLELIAQHGSGVSLVIPGVCRAILLARQTVKITDPKRLEQVLGAARYLCLVREKVTYHPEDRLVEMAQDPSEPLAPAISACLSISQSNVVTWRAER
jgi:hypothetical protein